MLKRKNEEKSFEGNIIDAINEIKSNNYALAREYLYAAMIENDHSAEVYNLLGTISEHKGDLSLACTYYRAAYVFDATYRPADKNLERVTSFLYIFNEMSIDYGDTMKNEHEKSYLHEYDGMHIGHLKNIHRDIKSPFN